MCWDRCAEEWPDASGLEPASTKLVFDAFTDSNTYKSTILGRFRTQWVKTVEQLGAVRNSES